MLNKKLNFSILKTEALAGLVVGFAIIPEAIAFSLIAGVSPQVGIYASICILLVNSIAGGRRALISAATGAMALVMVTLVKNYGIDYLLLAGILAGLIQILFAFLKIAKLMSYIPRSVMIAFVNALAILIFAAQLDEIRLFNLNALIVFIVALAIIYLFPLVPKIGKILPSSLLAIVLLTILSICFDFDVRSIKDLGELPSSLPSFLLPNVPLNLETLKIIFPYSLSLAIVGIVESLMTSSVLDEITASKSNKNRECIGQGISNIVANLFGGMAGCGMIGQSIINVKSGARTRISTFLAGFYLCLIILFFADFVNEIPMAVLVAIMTMVSIGTFDFSSIKKLKSNPFSYNFVMLSSMFITLYSHNLALGVVTGVILEALFFVNKLSSFLYCKKIINNDIITYEFSGQIFFKSTEKLYSEFDFVNIYKSVIIDVSKAHIWDLSAIYNLDKIILKLRQNGSKVQLLGLNEASASMLDKFSVINNEKESKKLLGGH
ncbi:SulP family inorganic anion transporter [Campylobacter canadensis]|uniref:SulP family inorganic anion transporter n=1 Tax=Campylobacter canadensis TaxID=449520 RepID=A0ABS7WR91_9BACT|nr:SulP family inorganic anion transporter [Campylobacter canadensis]